MINGRTILITGGTGSFGNKFIATLLQNYSPRRVVVYSRDEMKQWDMAKRFNHDLRLRFFIGDVRDRDRLLRACQDVDYIIHAAALKIVPSAEYNPFECVKTNIQGAMNVIDCAINAGIKRVVALSTDKACNPVNLYGATKLCSDKLFVAGNAYVGINQDTRFSVVRYGNVMGSRGSVIPYFRSIAKSGELTITDERMTRFMITLEQAVDLVWHALSHAMGGEIYVKKIPSMKVTDIARSIAPDAKLRFVGIRPGEKLHEQMISGEDARSTLDFDDHYVILPQIEFSDDRYHCYRNAKQCPEDFVYSSESNPQWMTVPELQSWMQNEYRNELLSDEDDYQPTSSAKSSAASEFGTIVVELENAIDNFDSIDPSLVEAMRRVKSSDYQSALSILCQTTPSSDNTFAPGELLKAVAQYKTGETLLACQSVLNVLNHTPSHQTAKRLLQILGNTVGG